MWCELGVRGSSQSRAPRGTHERPVLGRLPLRCLLGHKQVGFPRGLVVKSLPAMQERQVQSLGQEDPPEEETAIHSSILAWRIPMDRGAWWARVHGIASDLAHVQAGAGQAGEKVGPELREET